MCEVSKLEFSYLQFFFFAVLDQVMKVNVMVSGGKLRVLKLSGSIVFYWRKVSTACSA